MSLAYISISYTRLYFPSLYFKDSELLIKLFSVSVIIIKGNVLKVCGLLFNTLGAYLDFSFIYSLDLLNISSYTSI